MELGGARIELVAEVGRTDPQRSEAALLFRTATPPALAAIEQAIAALIAEARQSSPPAVLVLHSDAGVRKTLERDLSRLERRATLCATPLEAMWAVEDRTLNHVAIVIDATFGERLVDLVAHFAESHPNARRVVLFGEQLGAVDSRIARMVDGVLRAPWRFRALSRAIGVDLADSSIALLAADLDD
jgi:ActR/RegA family two-component response regulator